jgi:glycosyltransferase involved in cell wall biosynthesis
MHPNLRLNELCATRDVFLLVAPYCFNSYSPWYSPGRSQKILQVETLLASLSFALFRINTAPDLCPPSQIAHLQLSQSTFPPLRLYQSTFSILFFLFRQPFRRTRPILWIYNTRFSEALIAFVFLLFFPFIPVYLQVEDLPFARSQNSGVRGLLDLLCLYLLSRRANHIFVVSPVVGDTLQSMSRIRPCQYSVLPPLLSPDFLLAVDQRSQPFSRLTTTILYAGGYGFEKGVDNLVMAFLTLPSDNFLLQLVGAVPDSLVSCLSSDKRIHILGPVDNTQLYSLYSQADVLVNPHHVINRASSIFPFKLIEYVASGALPLTTPMPGVDMLGLPKDCLFETVEDLSLKLYMSRSLWIQHKHTISACSANIRYSHSYLAAQPSLAAQLRRNHVSSFN